MKVSKLMTKDVAYCYPDDSLTVPSALMWDHDCGIIPVVNDHRQLVGVITDRDICMAAFTQGRPLNALRTESAMARLVYFCRAHEPLTSAEDLMRKRQIRRLPVVDENERLVGLVSLSDMARHAARAVEQRAKGLEVQIPGATMAEIGETFSQICAPRTAPTDSRARKPVVSIA